MVPALVLVLSLALSTLAERSQGCKELVDPDEFKNLPSDLTLPFEDRDVWMSFPPGYRTSKPVPLILAFHDRGMTPQDMQKVTLFSNPNVNKNAIVLYPSARNVF